ncbi:DUF4026 domain-containing protein [Pseudomonas sp. F1_0610]|uniref:DUF4026 domain-containing protein n=1 Tax=Pseudomonas sp. F1_0610 TaxID=3114284 RepID=UPI0039C175CB
MSNKESYFAMAQGEAEPAISEIYAFSNTALSILEIEERLNEQNIFTDLEIDYDEDDEQSFMLRCSLDEDRLLFRILIRDQDPSEIDFTPYYATILFLQSL